MRRLLVALGCGLVVACGAIKLEEYPRPFACDRNGGDGGVQCNVGWACGFDDRCFEINLVLDGGQFVDQWRCTMPTHCPRGWQCGEEVLGMRNCQQLGFGAASPCLTDDGGCQGGWRCGTAARCFDPAVIDGGTERECARDGQCPDGFRCGQDVMGRHCLQLGVGADSACLNDDGCEGGRRCDPFSLRCVQVNDVVDSGSLTALGVATLSPLVNRPAPLLFAASRLSQVPTAFGGSAVNSLSPGILMAFLERDGGVRFVAQSDRVERQADGGHGKVLFEAMLPLPGASADVTDLVVTFAGPAVRFRDAGVFQLGLDGDAGRVNADLIRQADPLEPLGRTELVTVRYVDGGSVLSVGDVSEFLPGVVREAVALPGRLYAVADQGLFVVDLDAGAPDGGVGNRVSLVPDAGPRLPGVPTLGAAAGFPDELAPNRRLGLFVRVPLPDGVAGIAPFIPFETPGVVPACPAGSAAVQLAFDQGPDVRAAASVRCALPDGGAIPVQVRFKGNGAEYSGLLQDQVPYRPDSVFQSASPFGRAHAAGDGRAWHVLDLPGRGVVGSQPLRALLLDRQPDALVSFPDGFGSLLLAQSQGALFRNDPEVGLVSTIEDQVISPLSLFATNANWIITSGGVADRATSTDGPRLMAVMPAGVTLSPPVSGASAVLMRGGQPRDVLLVSSRDTLWVADVTEAKTSPFAQPALLEPVLVPVPGVRLRSMTLVPADGGLSGYLTTNSENLLFGTEDLVRWKQSPVASPSLRALPLEVWTENARGRTGFSDGRVWSLPIMVPLTQALVGLNGGALAASDYGRKCGDLFVGTAEGIFRAERGPDAGLPSWVPVAEINRKLDSSDALRFYETHDDTGDRLFVATRSGQVLELTSATSCP